MPPTHRWVARLARRSAHAFSDVACRGAVRARAGFNGDCIVVLPTVNTGTAATDVPTQVTNFVTCMPAKNMLGTTTISVGDIGPGVTNGHAISTVQASLAAFPTTAIVTNIGDISKADRQKFLKDFVKKNKGIREPSISHHGDRMMELEFKSAEAKRDFMKAWKDKETGRPKWNGKPAGSGVPKPIPGENLSSIIT